MNSSGPEHSLRPPAPSPKLLSLFLPPSVKWSSFLRPSNRDGMGIGAARRQREEGKAIDSSNNNKELEEQERGGERCCVTSVRPSGPCRGDHHDENDTVRTL